MSSTRDDISESSSLSSSPERVKRVRGAGRRGRGARGRGAQGSTATTTSRRSGRRRDVVVETTAQIQERQQRELMEQVDQMTPDELKNLVCRTITVMPGLMFDVMRPVEQPAGGFHPPPQSDWPDWCVCKFCRPVSTAEEQKCCMRVTCVSRLPRFDTLILDEGVLALARSYRRDILVYDDEADLMKANRHQAYRQYTLWSHGRLAAGDRRVIPACCVWRIRDKFPDRLGHYVGFAPSRLA